MYQGERCRPTLPMAPTPPNLAYARRLVADIQRRIALGTFDLAAEFPAYRGLERFGSRAPAALTVADYVGRWTQSNTGLSPSTLNGYRKIFNRYWLPWFGSQPVKAVRPSDVGMRMGAAGLEGKTWNNVLTAGRVVFDLAVADKAIADNPARAVEFRKFQRHAPDPFALDEIDAILPALAARWGPEVADYYEFAFFTGLRPNEQIELQWADIDFPRGQARVHRGRVRQVARATKTYVGRDIEIQSRALAVLDRQRARTQLAGRHVFLNPNTGKLWHDEKRQRLMFNASVKLLGIRHRPAYQTRHTYATILLMSGARPAWAAAQMGHSLEIFFRVYAKWIAGQDGGSELAKVEAFTGKSAGKLGGSGRL
jgi:integrase